MTFLRRFLLPIFLCCVQISKAQLLNDPHTAKEVEIYFSIFFTPVVKAEIAMTDSIQRLQLKSDKLIVKTHYSNDQYYKGWTKTFYDRKGRITKITGKSNNNGKQVSRILYHYSSDGKLRTSITRTNGKATSGDTTWYDDKGRPIRISDNRSESGPGWTEYDYDPSGNVIRVTTNYNCYHTQTDFTYDGKNRPTGKVCIQTDSLGKRDTFSFALARYDSLDRLVHYRSFDKGSFSFIEGNPGSYMYWQQECNFTYDKEGIVIRREEKNTYNRTIHTYLYTDNHRLLQEDKLFNDTIALRYVHHYSAIKDSVVTYRLIAAYPNEPLPAVSEYTIYLFNSSGKIISMRRFSPWYPSPIDGYECTYDSHGNWTGRDMLSHDFQTGEVRNWPSNRLAYDKRGLNVLSVNYYQDGKENMRARKRYAFY